MMLTAIVWLTGGLYPCWCDAARPCRLASVSAALTQVAETIPRTPGLEVCPTPCCPQNDVQATRPGSAGAG